MRSCHGDSEFPSRYFTLAAVPRTAFKHSCLLACGQLSLSRANLLVRQSASARAAEAGAHQAALARTLGNHSGLELRLCTLQSCDQEIRLECDYICGPGHGGPG